MLLIIASDRVKLQRHILSTILNFVEQEVIALSQKCPSAMRISESGHISTCEWATCGKCV